jgi:transposase
MDLTDEQWKLIEALVPAKPVVGAGRPPQSIRRVLDGVLWKLRTASAWDDLPAHYPSHQTCYRYYAAWRRSGVLRSILQILYRELQAHGFDIFAALKSGDIEVVSASFGSVLFFGPHLKGTWQASTVFLFLQIAYAWARKTGRLQGKLVPASDWSASPLVSPPTLRQT